MKYRKPFGISCAELKTVDMVSVLYIMGFSPAKISGNNYWYLSPLRKENTPSFKINRSINRWYDHGIGKGGNLVDFGILYYQCTVSDWLKKAYAYPLCDARAFQPQPCLINHRHQSSHFQSDISIRRIDELSNPALIQYLHRRKISVNLAGKYCKQVTYLYKRKSYLAIGFKNNRGGYEMRNQYCKNSSSPKGITTIKNGAAVIAVFEGFFDFLSWKMLYVHHPGTYYDFCILNSLAFFENTRGLLESYKYIHLFLDNDTAGQYCSASAISSSIKYFDYSYIYEGYKDINDYLVSSCDNGLLHIHDIPP